MQNTNEENRGMAPSESVAVLQAMGRTAGFLPAASRLADPYREMPLQIYTTESGHSLESLADNVNRQLGETGRCIVVVSEGFNVGEIGEAYDGFGHIEYGASETATAQVVASYLNRQGLCTRGQATWQMPGVLQRSTSAYLSVVDAEEACRVGRHAVTVALDAGSGWMATILRAPGETYAARYDKVPLTAVANSVRHLPAAWLSSDGLDVTDDFIHYAQPLTGNAWPPLELENGRQRFARLDIVFVSKHLPRYVPVRCR